MQTNPFSYLFLRGIQAIERFLSHWYILVFYAYWGYVTRSLLALDRYFAFRVTLLNIFNPLYQDYSFLGYVLGIFFRSILLFFGGIVYAVILIVALAIYFVWVSIPPILVLRIL